MQHIYDTTMDHSLPFAQFKSPFMFASVNNVVDDDDDNNDSPQRCF
jgi:hypothetical protein